MLVMAWSPVRRSSSLLKNSEQMVISNNRIKGANRLKSIMRFSGSVSKSILLIGTLQKPFSANCYPSGVAAGREGWRPWLRSRRGRLRLCARRDCRSRRCRAPTGSGPAPSRHRPERFAVHPPVQNEGCDDARRRKTGREGGGLPMPAGALPIRRWTATASAGAHYLGRGWTRRRRPGGRIKARLTGPPPCRAAATSGRSCSAACRVFFEAHLMTPEERTT